MENPMKFSEDAAKLASSWAADAQEDARVASAAVVKTAAEAAAAAWLAVVETIRAGKDAGPQWEAARAAHAALDDAWAGRRAQAK